MKASPPTRPPPTYRPRCPGRLDMLPDLHKRWLGYQYAHFRSDHTCHQHPTLAAASNTNQHTSSLFRRARPPARLAAVLGWLLLSRRFSSPFSSLPVVCGTTTTVAVAENDRGSGQNPDPPQGLRVPRDALRVDTGGKHAGRAAAEPRVLGVQAADAGKRAQPRGVVWRRQTDDTVVTVERRRSPHARWLAQAAGDTGHGIEG